MAAAGHLRGSPCLATAVELTTTGKSHDPYASRLCLIEEILRRLNCRIHKGLGASALWSSDWRILAALVPGTGPSIQRLADIAGLPKGSASKSVRRLQRLGLVTVSRVPARGPSCAVALHPAGKAVLAAEMAVWSRSMPTGLGGLTVEELWTLIALVEKSIEGFLRGDEAICADPVRRNRPDAVR